MPDSNNTVHVGAGSSPAPNYDVRLVKVESDVAGLSRDIGEVKASMSTGFERLGAQIAAKGQTNWHALSLIGMAAIAILGWGWALFGTFQSRTEQQIAEQKARAEKFVDRADITSMFSSTKEIGDLKSQLADLRSQLATGIAIDKSTDAFATKAQLQSDSAAAATRSAENKERITQLRERVIKLEDNLVSRHEHEINNARLEKQLDEMRLTERHDTDEMKARFDQLSPASDLLKDLRDRVRSTESKVIELQAKR